MNNSTITNNAFDLVGELERTYRVLERERASMQNHIDIKAWESQGIINHDEAQMLHEINFKLARKYRHE